MTPADDVMIIYTSGSTGDPKAPVHTQGTLVRHTYNLTFDYGVTGDTVMFTAMPFFWVGGLITGVHAVIHHGATLVTQPAFDAAEALELIERHRATITLGWPQQGKTLAEHPDFANRDLSSVQRTSMPAMVPPERRPEGPQRTGHDRTLREPHRRRPVSAAAARPGGDRWTLDRRPVTRPRRSRYRDSRFPSGTDGEIWVRGYSLMQRLYKREREEVFTPDGYYRTGDCGVEYGDGWIKFTGRLGDLIKTGGGTNVTPSEVELALTNCDGVLEAYVVGAEDGANGTVVAAAVVPRGDAGHRQRRPAEASARQALGVQGAEVHLGHRQGDVAVHRHGEGQEVGPGRSAERSAGPALDLAICVFASAQRNKTHTNHYGRLVVSKVNGITHKGSSFTSVTSNPSPDMLPEVGLHRAVRLLASSASRSVVATTPVGTPSPASSPASRPALAFEDTHTPARS